MSDPLPSDPSHVGGRSTASLYAFTGSAPTLAGGYELTGTPEGSLKDRPGVPAGPARIGRYEVLGELGRGGMGVVYCAQDPKFGTHYAIKVLLDSSPARRERFRREIDALWKLNHPNVVGLKDAGLESGDPWLAMELVRGESVEDILVREGPLSIDEAIRFADQLCDALIAAHELGILHRDIKPDNVIRQSEGRFLLADFGLTGEASTESEADQGAPSQPSLTRTGALQGTPGYWAPEQATGQATGTATDVYLFGSTLYAVLTGCQPAAGESLLELVVATTERQPTAPRALRAEVPADLEAIVLRCLEKEPADRYASFRDLKVDLGYLRAGQPLAERTATTRDELLPLKRVGLLLLAAILLAPCWEPLGDWFSESRTKRIAAERSRLEVEALRLATSRQPGALEASLAAAKRGSPRAMLLAADFLAEEDEERSRRWLEAAGEHLVEAQLRLARGSEGAEALRWWLRASSGGSSEATLAVGRIREASGNWSEALRWFARAESRGNSEAASARRGLLLELGYRAEAKGDHEEALTRFRAALPQLEAALALARLTSDMEGQVAGEALLALEEHGVLGREFRLHLLGQTVGASILLERAAELAERGSRESGFWYLQAARGGSAPGRRACLELLSRDPIPLTPLVFRRARGGDRKAALVVAQEFWLGRGLPKSDVSALKWSLAARGEPEADSMIVDLTFEGQAVARDWTRARRILKASATTPREKLLLAQLILKGFGGPSDPEEAFRLVESTPSSPERDGLLGYLFATGQGVVQDESAGHLLLTEAARQGDATALVDLAGLLNSHEAYLRAVSAGSPEAIFMEGFVLKWRKQPELIQRAAVAGSTYARLLIAVEDLAGPRKFVNRDERWIREARAELGLGRAPSVTQGARWLESSGGRDPWLAAGHEAVLDLLEGRARPARIMPRAVSSRRKTCLGVRMSQAWRELLRETNYAPVNRLGWLAACERRDFVLAAGLLRPSAKRGSAIAMRSLGVVSIREGQPERAVPWLKRAAEKGDGLAMLELGSILVRRGATEVSDGVGKRWLRQGLDALGYSEDPAIPKALKWVFFDRASRTSGLERLHWLRRAARHGHSQAQYEIFLALEARGLRKHREIDPVFEDDGLAGIELHSVPVLDGKGRPYPSSRELDHQERVARLWVSARQGHRPALARLSDLSREDQEVLGAVLCEGRFLRKDVVEGRMWLERSRRR
jgi:serine/threonine protein kinase/TPR repeat protein